MNSLRHWAKTLLFLIVYIFSGLTLVLIIDTVVTGGPDLAPFNDAINSVIVPMRNPFLTKLMVLITTIASPVILTIASIFISIYLIIHKKTYDTLLYLVSIFLAIVGFIVLKQTFHLSRPEDGILDISGWSFPSGHATVATAFFLATGYAFFDWAKTIAGKTILAVGCVLGAVLVSFSRVYLGVHFALDILAGIALGLLSVSFAALIFNIFLAEREWRMRSR